MSSITPPLRYAALSCRAIMMAHLAAAAAVLVVAALGLMVLESSNPQPLGWLSMTAVVIALGAVVAATMSEDPGPGVATMTMVAGIVAVFIGTIVMHAAYPEQVVSTASFVLLVPKLVLLAAGSALDRITPTWVGATLGAGIAEIATVGAGMVAGVPWHIDWEFAIIAASVSIGGLLARVGMRQHEAAFASLAATTPPIRRDDEDAAAGSRALVHDTVLNELILLTTLPAGELPPAAADEIRLSLDRVERSLVTRARSPQHPEAIAELVRRFGDAGLDVEISSETEGLQRALGPRFDPLVAAIEQCLTNTLRHSGARTVDLVVAQDPHRVSALVVDEGRGFDPASVPPDRLGLRESVRARIEQLGGRVTVWSAPGQGTMVAIEVPVDQNAGADPALRGGSRADRLDGGVPV